MTGTTGVDAGSRGDEGISSSAGHPVCDGTSQLRVRFFLEGRNGSELRGSTVRIENGYPSFAMDGNCVYWMSGGWVDVAGMDGRDLDWRTGHADAVLREALTKLPLQHLDTLADCKPSSIADASARVISDGTSGGSCVEAGPIFDAAWSIVGSMASELWAAATPMTAGLRVSAVSVSSGDDSEAYAWPAGSYALASFMLPDSLLFSSGGSRFIADAAMADKVRAVRSAYLQDRKATPGLFYDGQKMSDGTSEAIVYMRDALPYEDDHGLLPLGRPH